jgi:hypothetical protein
MTHDPELDTALADVLARRRPIGAVPLLLRQRVAAVSAERRVSITAWRVRSALVSTAASVAVLVVVGYIGLYALGEVRRVPGAAPATSLGAVGLDPTVSGPGIVRDVTDDVHTIPGGIGTALVVVLLVIVGLRTRPGWRRALAFALVLLGPLAAPKLPDVAAVKWANVYGSFLSVEQSDTTFESGSPYESRPVWYIAAAPGEPFGVLLDIKNTGALPVHVLGLIGPTSGPAEYPAWSAVWTWSDQTGGVPPPGDARQFEPFDLEPGQSSGLMLVGRAGACALGPRIGDSALRFAVIDRIALAYTVLGLSAVSTVDLPMVLQEPDREDCPITVSPSP